MGGCSHGRSGAAPATGYTVHTQLRARYKKITAYTGGNSGVSFFPGEFEISEIQLIITTDRGELHSLLRP